jgi:Flp pilus assembly protein TadB
MKTIDIAALYRKYQHLVTVQNVGLAVALLVAFTWVWGAVATLQQNYQHQRRVDENAQQIELMKLQNQNYAYQQAYYKSDEFLELSARQKLGKAFPGEKLVLLPSSAGVHDTTQPVAAKPVVTESNFSKWMDFFFGGSRSKT